MGYGNMQSLADIRGEVLSNTTGLRQHVLVYRSVGSGSMQSLADIRSEVGNDSVREILQIAVKHNVFCYVIDVGLELNSNTNVSEALKKSTR